MEKVTTDCNDRQVDQLNGKDFVHGEKIIVKWPIGGVTTEIVQLKTSSYVTYDVDGQYTVKIARAFVKVNYNGVVAKVYLADSDLLCERI